MRRTLDTNQIIMVEAIYLCKVKTSLSKDLENVLKDYCVGMHICLLILDGYCIVGIPYAQSMMSIYLNNIQTSRSSKAVEQ